MLEVGSRHEPSHNHPARIVDSTKRHSKGKQANEGLRAPRTYALSKNMLEGVVEAQERCDRQKPDDQRALTAWKIVCIPGNLSASDAY
jgi:hypothetical protein